MSSMSGYVTYIEYVAGKNKGQTENGDLFNSPFKLGDVNSNYTSDAVVENFQAAASPAAVTPVWGPVATGVFDYNNTKYDFKLLDYGTDSTYASTPTVTYGNFVDGQIPAASQTASHYYKVAYRYDNVIVPQNDLPTLRAEMKSISLIAKARRIAVFYSQIAA